MACGTDLAQVPTRNDLPPVLRERACELLNQRLAECRRAAPTPRNTWMPCRSADAMISSDPASPPLPDPLEGLMDRLDQAHAQWKRPVFTTLSAPWMQDRRAPGAARRLRHG